VKIAAVKGMKDVLPTAQGEDAAFNSRIWERIEAASRKVFALYGFEFIHTPVLEESRLFARAVGEDTDIVGKEMYAFEDRGGKHLALRPENTAGAVRAYVEQGLPMRDPVQRWCYFGPMFRRERPQRHRYRQFFQLGVESFGVAAPEEDVEILALCRDLVEAIGLGGVELRLNSLGDAACRPAYLQILRAFLEERRERLCADCRRRIERNPLRALDCKEPGCVEATRGAPAAHEHLCGACKEHFDRVIAGTTALGIPYVLDGRLVRGLDYYTRTAFEISASALGKGQQTAVCGGGRYDALVQMLGGPPTPAIGFAMGVERIAFMLADAEGVPAHSTDLFLAFIDAQGREKAQELARAARRRGIRTEMDLRGGKVSRQLSRADKRGARFAVVLGGSEVESGRARLKEMATGEETELSLDALVEEVWKRR